MFSSVSSHTAVLPMELPEQPPLDLGRSMKVPSVQELAKESPVKIPPRYVRLMDGALPADVSSDGSASWSVPIIDLERLVAGDSMDSEVEKLHSACKEWGFFQVVNHGVNTKLLEELKLEAKKLFELPYEEKQKLWQQPNAQEGFGQYFVGREDQKLDWSDMFAVTTLPLYIRDNALFNKLPPNFRETLEIYSSETKRVVLELLGNIAKALKIDVEEMKEMFNDGFQAMRINYYPPCPEPEKALGFTPHSDADALTILFHLNETEGLQIRKNGGWVPIKPLPNAFIVNIGDIMEIMSNGIYKSIEHRATVHSTKERLSIVTFYNPNIDTVLCPMANLIGPQNPPKFHQVPLKQYFKNFFARNLNGKTFIDFMRIADE